MATSRHQTLLAASAAALLPFLVTASPVADLQASFQTIANKESAKYNCSVSIAYRDAKGIVAAAGGFVDGQTPARPEDGYAFGSVTKVLTGASILRLAAEGHIDLDGAVSPLVDPLLSKMADEDPHQGFRSLADLWGSTNVTNLTVRQLLGMETGVPDFDTATPCFPGQPACIPTDKLRKDLYDDPAKGYSPTRLMAVPWVANQWKGPCSRAMPGMRPFCYSSTNFMILGLVLLAHQQAGDKPNWTQLDQAAYLPDYLKDKIEFANSGSPANYTHVHGFDRTSYNRPKGQHANHDDWKVSGVFSGWTASDIVTSAAGVSNLTWEVYGPPASIVPKEFGQKMIPDDKSVYGLATFNLDRVTGQTGKYGKAYGHLGATYGYQSVTAYFPKLEFAITIATNIERDYQEQPSDTLCFAYNAAAGVLLNRTINCVFTSGGFYGGGCKCDPIEDEEQAIFV